MNRLLEKLRKRTLKQLFEEGYSKATESGKRNIFLFKEQLEKAGLDFNKSLFENLRNLMKKVEKEELLCFIKYLI